MYSFDTRVRYSELKEDRMVSLVSIINYFQDCCSFESRGWRCGAGLDGGTSYSLDADELAD